MAVQSFVIPAGANADSITGYCCCKETFAETVQGGPLDKRVWALRERFIPPQTVHFAKEEVGWKCSSSMTMECLPVYLKSRLKAKDSTSCRDVCV